MMKSILTIIVCTVWISLSAQYTYWEHVIGDQELFTNTELYDGGILSYGGGAEEPILLRKHDMNGNMLMENQIHLPYTGTYYIGVKQNLNILPDESIMIGANMHTVELGATIFLCNVDANLDSLWTIHYKFEDEITVMSSMIIRDSTMVISGFTWPSESGDLRARTFILEMDFEGNILLEKTIQPYNDAYAYRNWVLQEFNGGYLLAGRKRILNLIDELGEVTPFRATITKLDYDGNLIWEYELDDEPNVGFGNGSPTMTLTENEDLIVTYSTAYEVYFDPDYHALSYNKQTVLKLNYQGDEPSVGWEQVYYDNYEKKLNGGSKIIETMDGGFLLTCSALPQGVPQSSTSSYGFILKFDSMGNEEWYQEYVVFDNFQNYLITHNIWDIEITPDGGYVFVGYIFRGDMGYYSWIVKIDACGEVEYNGCEPVVGIDNMTTDQGILVWPQPANSELIVQWNRTFEVSEVVVLSITGSEVKRIKSSNISEEQMTMNIEGLSNGLFIIHLLDHKGVLLGSKKVVVER